MKVGIWVNSQLTLEKWQVEAIRNIRTQNCEITEVFALKDDRRKRNVKFGNVLYYLILGSQRKLVRLASSIKISKVKEIQTLRVTWLDYESKGNWYSVKTSNIKSMSKLDVIVKFDGSLLRNPEEFEIPYGVISFHHGNPEKFRGRPAIFWELFSGSQEIGIVVQQICSKLDSGKVLSFANIKLNNYSYRQNIKNLYKISTFMLSSALNNLESQKQIPMATNQKLYRLPINSITFQVILKLLINKLRHILNVLFLQKVWWIAKIQLPIMDKPLAVISRKEIVKIEGPEGSFFVADPMADPDGLIYAEVVNPPLFRGSIYVLKSGSWTRLEGKNSISGHYSYPQVVLSNEKKFIFAETAYHSPPYLMQLSDSGEEVKSVHFLKGLGKERIADGTLFQYQGNWYLFGSARKSNYSILHLWVSESLDREFEEHISSPISFDVTSQRMAGPITEINSVLFRFGQDCSSRYGSCINVSRIEKLTRSEYQETKYGQISIEEGFGPHTLSVLGDTAFIDGYEEHWNLAAILRKILARI